MKKEKQLRASLFDKLKTAFEEKYSFIAHVKNNELKDHPPYSLDLAPSVFSVSKAQSFTQGTKVFIKLQLLLRRIKYTIYNETLLNNKN